MQGKRMTWAVVAASALLVTAACDQVRDPAGVDPTVKVPSWVAALVVPTPGKNEVWACKDGPPGTYNFTVVANTPHVTLNAGSPFTLTVTGGDNPSNECKLVATATKKRQAVTVSEPPGTVPGNRCFDHADIYHYVGGVLVPPVVTSTDSDVDIDMFGPDNTYTIVFVNRVKVGDHC